MNMLTRGPRIRSGAPEQRKRFNSQGTQILIKKCLACMHCKLLWIKASAKCINVNALPHTASDRMRFMHVDSFFETVMCFRTEQTHTFECEIVS